MGRRLEDLLKEWGAFHARNIDFADEYGENILYGAQLFQGRIQYGQSGSKILCQDTPSHLQRVDIAVNKLPFAQKGAIVLFYCSPIKESGLQYTKPELAKMLYKRKGCVGELDRALRVGKIKLEILLK
jgi:hypothetical protein